jgi:hypothetical protein
MNPINIFLMKANLRSKLSEAAVTRNLFDRV